MKRWWRDLRRRLLPVAIVSVHSPDGDLSGDTRLAAGDTLVLSDALGSVLSAKVTTRFPGRVYVRLHLRQMEKPGA